MDSHHTSREHWSGAWGLILAAAGSAIGLGNIWKFPYIVGENGGGAFVLVYLLCIAVIGAPVMICEFALGRHTQRNPVGAFKALSPKTSVLAHLVGLLLVLAGFFLLLFRFWGWGAILLGLGALVFRFGWILVGAMGVVAGFTILSFYSVVAGWTSATSGKRPPINSISPAWKPPENTSASSSSIRDGPSAAISCSSCCAFSSSTGASVPASSAGPGSSCPSSSC